jgi:hypothetical protein
MFLAAEQEAVRKSLVIKHTYSIQIFLVFLGLVLVVRCKIGDQNFPTALLQLAAHCELGFHLLELVCLCLILGLF